MVVESDQVHTPSPAEVGRTPRPEEIFGVAAPPALASSILVLGLEILRASGLANALKAARFVNLLLASLLLGNGAGALLATHPALRSLPTRAFFEAERALTWRYGRIMRVLMPAALVSCLALLRLERHRRSAGYRLTLAGTAAVAGVLATTAVELLLNRQTLRTSPDAPLSEWRASRERWDRFNLLRTALAAAAWALLCLAALAGTKHARA